MFVRLCVLLPLPHNLTTMVLLVLSVFGGVELRIEVVLLGILLFVCWHDIKEGNGVYKSVLGDRCGNCGSIFVVWVCVE